MNTKTILYFWNATVEVVDIQHFWPSDHIQNHMCMELTYELLIFTWNKYSPILSNLLNDNQQIKWFLLCSNLAAFSKGNSHSWPQIIPVIDKQQIANVKFSCAPAVVCYLIHRDAGPSCARAAPQLPAHCPALPVLLARSVPNSPTASETKNLSGPNSFWALQYTQKHSELFTTSGRSGELVLQELSLSVNMKIKEIKLRVRNSISHLSTFEVTKTSSCQQQDWTILQT